MRYLNEVMWFPTAYLAEAITWQAVDDNSARITMSDRGRSATALMRFDDEGKLVNFIADRFNTETKAMEVWQTPVTSYGDRGGLNIPLSGQGVWARDAGEFVYIELDVTEVSFD
jgi:hypothetical protein